MIDLTIIAGIFLAGGLLVGIALGLFLKRILEWGGSTFTKTKMQQLTAENHSLQESLVQAMSRRRSAEQDLEMTKRANEKLSKWQDNLAPYLEDISSHAKFVEVELVNVREGVDNLRDSQQILLDRTEKVIESAQPQQPEIVDISLEEGEDNDI